ncbi:MAG: Undecaprenyldiphospho-muramoylpentapeptide beta-N-acetylglucosaminyltransferase [uncultured bacterium]|nr:MAG: Undecaprenyldiphospho-muramoylpentapeptide beta-N-acetylglucosaminyltransferase [uncultured bacterium]
MTKLRRVLIMAGGTGGHVFPGLAVAKRLCEKGIQVEWLGTRKGLEATLIPTETEIPLHFITISGVRGKGIKDILLAPIRLTVAIWQALRIIRRLQPDVVLGMGGFASGPGGIASWLLGYPLVIHEQNAKPGTTNKWLAHRAKKVLEGFPHTFAKRKQVVTIGNPIRKEIADLPPPIRQNKTHCNLLVLGGSLGAAAINQLLPEALAKLPEALRPQVYHQTGEKHYAATLTAYQQAGLTANIVPFIKKMDQAYAWADIVLCRAGALTITELCAAGRGAILVPFPYAIDDHQTANANFMAQQNAALLVQQATLTADKLAEILAGLIQSPERYQAMAEAAYALRQINATEQVLAICEEICERY